MDNKNNKTFLTYKWLVGILVAIVIMSVAGWAGTLQGRVSAGEMENDIQNKDIAILQANYKNIIDRFDSMEKKLDSVLRIRSTAKKL